MQLAQVGTTWLQTSLMFLVAAVIAVPLFRKLKLGAVLGYLAAGIILGPYGFHWVANPDSALHFAEFGVVMLLFLIGLELEPSRLWQMRRQMGLVGGGQLVITAIILTPLLMLFSGAWSLAIILAVTLALSSTAFAIQLMQEGKILTTPLGRTGFSILLLQDLVVVPLLLATDALSTQTLLTNDTAENAQSFPILYSILTLAAVIVLGKLFLNTFLRAVATYANREVMTAASLLIVLGVAQIMDAVDLSMGLGAFIAGVLLANSDFRHQLETDIEPFKGLLLGLFFIAVGMTMNLDLFMQSPLLILFFALLLMAVKTGVIGGILRWQGNSWKDAFSLGILLSQGGEFAFVVVAQALSGNLIEIELAQMLILVVGVSMTFTVPAARGLQFIFERYLPKINQPFDQPGKDSEDSDTPEVILAGFGRFGQIIGRILAANKIPFTALDKDPSHVDFVRRIGNKLYYGDAVRMDLLRSAGIEQAKLLVVAVDNVEDALKIIEQAQQCCPNITIIARARNRMHAYRLYALGVKYVVRETFESSLSAAVQTLIQLGMPEGQALEKIDMFRLHDERMIQDSIGQKDDLEALIQIARQGRKELEQIFDQD